MPGLVDLLSRSLSVQGDPRGTGVQGTIRDKVRRYHSLIHLHASLIRCAGFSAVVDVALDALHQFTAKVSLGLVDDGVLDV